MDSDIIRHCLACLIIFVILICCFDRTKWIVVPQSVLITVLLFRWRIVIVMMVASLFSEVFRLHHLIFPLLLSPLVLGPKIGLPFCYAILSWICIFLLKWFSQDRAKVSLLSKSYFIFRFWILEDFLLKIKLSSLVLLMVSLFVYYFFIYFFFYIRILLLQIFSTGIAITRSVSRTSRPWGHARARNPLPP